MASGVDDLPFGNQPSGGVDVPATLKALLKAKSLFKRGGAGPGGGIGGGRGNSPPLGSSPGLIIVCSGSSDRCACRGAGASVSLAAGLADLLPFLLCVPAGRGGESRPGWGLEDAPARRKGEDGGCPGIGLEAPACRKGEDGGCTGPGLAEAPAWRRGEDGGCPGVGPEAPAAWRSGEDGGCPGIGPDEPAACRKGAADGSKGERPESRPDLGVDSGGVSTSGSEPGSGVVTMNVSSPLRGVSGG